LSIYKLLDRMLSLVESSPTVPFFGLKLIGSRDLQNLIEQSVAELPEELAEARQLVSHEEQILFTARRQAEEIVARAQQEANHLVGSAHEQMRRIVNESEVVKAINNEAERIREQVRSEAQRIYQLTEQEIAEAEDVSRRQIRHVLDGAIVEAENIRRGANSYAEAVLHELERTTLGAISIIQNGQRQLEGVSKQNNRAEQFNKFKAALSEVKNIHSDLLLDPNEALRSGLPPMVSRPDVPPQTPPIQNVPPQNANHQHSHRIRPENSPQIPPNYVDPNFQHPTGSVTERFPTTEVPPPNYGFGG
jgi:cell division septum initiation protein DivIVA